MRDICSPFHEPAPQWLVWLIAVPLVCGLVCGLVLLWAAAMVVSLPARACAAAWCLQPLRVLLIMVLALASAWLVSACGTAPSPVLMCPPVPAELMTPPAPPVLLTPALRSPTSGQTTTPMRPSAGQPASGSKP